LLSIVAIDPVGGVVDPPGGVGDVLLLAGQLGEQDLRRDGLVIPVVGPLVLGDGGALLARDVGVRRFGLREVVRRLGAGGGLGEPDRAEDELVAVAAPGLVDAADRRTGLVLALRGGLGEVVELAGVGEQRVGVRRVARA